MNLPDMPMAEEKNRKYIVDFKGLNLGMGAQDGELADCWNLSTKEYPCLSQRGSREVKTTLTDPQAIFSRGELCYVDGTGFYYNGTLKGTVVAGPKQFAVIGGRVVIFPDKKMYNPTDDSFISLEASQTKTGVTFTDSALKAADAFSGFSEGDGLTISGCTKYPENNKTVIVREISGGTLTFYDNTFTAGAETGTVTVSRTVPDMDFICESGNRLWGCGNGQIYASKLGDPLNFNVFDGLASDSFAVAVGSDGAFTGCIGYSTHIAFFKEDVVHKMYGTKPSNFQLTEGRIQGVQAGCDKSMVIINETLYYKSRAGIMAYTGSIPELVSGAFGAKRFGMATAGTDGERYYVSMQDGSTWGLYVYDVLRGLWIHEDSTHVLGFAAKEGSLYYLDSDSGELLRMEAGTGDVVWSATMAEVNETVPERKGYGKVFLRVELLSGFMKVEANVDRAGWRQISTVRKPSKRVLQIPIIPTRCDCFQIRLSGNGRCRVHALVREFLYGSDA